MKKTQTISLERLRAILSYNPETGDLVWASRPSPTAHLSKIGKVAGQINNGYRYVTIDGQVYLAQRLAWFHYYGEWPDHQLAFVDSDRLNLRIENLQSKRALPESYPNTPEGRAAYTKAYNAAFKSKARDKHLQKVFGISLADYHQMHADQDGVCAICGRPEKMRRWGKDTPLAVDHNHDTGKVRALLCSDCNTCLGKMEENEGRLLAAVQYLREHNSGWVIPKPEGRSAYAGYY